MTTQQAMPRNRVSAFRLTGDLDRVALQRSLDAIGDGRAMVQSVVSGDTSLLHQPFSESESAVRFVLSEQGPKEYTLVMVLHPNLSDSCSIMELWRRLADFYSSSLAGTARPAAPFPPADDLHREFWRRTLAESPAPSQLIEDRSGLDGDTDCCHLGIPSELLQRMPDGFDCGAVWLAGLEALLALCSGDSEVLLGLWRAPPGALSDVLLWHRQIHLEDGFAAHLSALRRWWTQVNPHSHVAWTTMFAGHPQLRRVPIHFAWRQDSPVPTRMGPLELTEVWPPACLDCDILFESHQARLTAVFRKARFHKASVERFLEWWLHLVQSGLEQPEHPCRLPMGPIVEGPAWSPVSLTARWQGVCRVNSDALVVDGLSRGELEAWSNGLAQALSKPVGPRVGLAMGRCPELVVAQLAVLKSGRAYVPLNPHDPRWPEMARQAEVDTILQLEDVHSAPPSSSLPQVDCRPDDPACILFTSGSTGQPKGVVLPHRSLSRIVEDDSSQVWLGHTDIGFDAWSWEVWAALLSGSRLKIWAPELAREQNWSEALDGVTSMFLPTYLLPFALRDQRQALQRLRRLLVGGEALPQPTARLAVELLPEVEVRNIYGPTECGVMVAWAHLKGENTVFRTPLGGPLPGTQLWVADADGRPLPVGVPGELRVGGAAVGLGYLNQGFVDGVYRTGDRVRWDRAENLDYLARMDRQVKVRGFRVEPGEVERVLLDCPAVQAASVQARPGPRGEMELAAYLVGDQQAAAEYLRERLPEFLQPRYFVSVSELPLTSRGKLDRRRLPWPPQAPSEPALPVPGGSVAERFQSQAEHNPTATALREGSQEHSYLELFHKAQSLASRLRAHQIQSGEVVGICLPRSLEAIAWILGIWMAGGTYLPLLPTDPPGRREWMVRDASLRLLITERGVEPLPSEPPRAPAGVAYLLYTSGSSGEPKGVMGTHAGLLNRVDWMERAFPFQAGEVVCHKTSLAFVDSLWEVFGALLCGAVVAIVEDERVGDPRRLAQFLQARSVTRLVLVPSLLRALLESVPDFFQRTPTLRICISSGEALAPELARCALDSDCLLLNLYGCTEAAADATWFDCSQTPGFDQVVPIGRAIDGMQVHVLDEDMLPATEGELYLSGAGLAEGYWRQPERTAESFVLLADSNLRAYRTGDRGRLRPDGTLEYLGRLDRQVKIRGHRVELDGLETLVKGMAGVDEAAVLAEAGPDGLARLAVYYTGPKWPDELRRALKQSLPAWSLPSVIERLETLPRLPSGKPDRRAAQKSSQIDPRVQRIWEEVLGVPVEPDDNFFEVGGHSLLAVTLCNRLETEFGVRIPIAAFAAGPTLLELTRTFREGWKRTTIVPIQKGTGRRPFFVIPGLGGRAVVFSRLALGLGSDQPVYVCQPPNLEAYDLPALGRVFSEEIVRIQPEGPYLVGGHSLGGLIAFEVARQLQSAGRQVEWLCLFDTWLPTTIRWDMRWAFASRALQHVIKRESGGSPRFGIFMQERLAGWQFTNKDLADYAVRPYQGQVVLFRASIQPWALRRTSALGWERYLQPAPRVIPYGGGHEEVTREPVVTMVANELRKLFESG